MADNVGYTPGSGATIAADDVGGTLYQRVKLAIGADGEATDASSTNPLPVYDDSVRQILAPMVGLLESPRGYDKSLQRQRGTVIIESGTVTTVSTVSTVTTCTTVTTCSTVTNLSQIDNIQGRIGQLGENLSAWSACVRARIS
jgi:hypothetical protein